MQTSFRVYDTETVVIERIIENNTGTGLELSAFNFPMPLGVIKPNVTSGIVLGLLQSTTIYSKIEITAVSVSKTLWTGTGTTRRLKIWIPNETFSEGELVAEITVSKSDPLINDFYTSYLDTPLLISDEIPIYVIGCLSETGDSTIDDNDPITVSLINNLFIAAGFTSSDTDVLTFPTIDSSGAIFSVMCNVLYRLTV